MQVDGQLDGSLFSFLIKKIIAMEYLPVMVEPNALLTTEELNEIIDSMPPEMVLIYGNMTKNFIYLFHAFVARNAMSMLAAS